MHIIILVLLAFTAVPEQANHWDPALVLRARERRSAFDLDTVWRACESYRQDHGRFPRGKTVQEIEKFLSPRYILHLPKFDAWGQPIAYIVDTEDRHVRLVSGADDRVIDKESLAFPEIIEEPIVPVFTSRPAQDLIFQDGSLIQGPPELMNLLSEPGHWPPN